MTTQTEQEQQAQQQQQQQYEQQAQQAASQFRPQAQFDSIFADTISQSGIDQTGRQAWEAYFNLAEETLRTTRRVSEVYQLSLMQGHMVKQISAQVAPIVAATVISQLQQHPEWLKLPVQQVAREMQLTKQ